MISLVNSRVDDVVLRFTDSWRNHGCPALILTCLAALVTVSGVGSAQEPRVFLLDGRHLQQMREDVQRRPAAYTEAIRVIRDDADDAMDEGPWSVLDKPLTPPSGDKHDYYSVGPYWWPDPDSDDGLPYIRRDGEVNPDRNKYDNVGLGRTNSAVRDLAYGWYFTGEAAYAERAALLLRTWFLDPDTRMNPHLQFGQAIPGRVDGRGIGIIDTAGLMDLVDAIGLLESSDAWTDDDQAQLQDWFRDYLHWLRTSEHGIDEANTSNNHAVYYDAQVASYALFVEDEATARDVLEQVGTRRIATQIEPDGTMPRELARTKSFSYAHMNLRGFLHLVRLGEHVGVDLWNFRTDDGRSVPAALDWLAPFVAGDQAWTHEQITPLEPAKAAPLYLRAGRYTDTPAYRRIADSIDDPLTLLLWGDPQLFDR